MEETSVAREGSFVSRKRTRMSAPRKKRSKRWKYFDQEVSDGNYVLTCKICSHTYTGTGDPSKCGGNLGRHLEKHDLEEKEPKGCAYASLDQALFREKMCAAIIRHNYPFTFVEHKGTRELLSFLHPGVEHITRNTIKAEMLKLYRKEKEKVKQEIERIPSRVCLTSGIWSNPAGDGYMTLTAHFVDEDWILQKRVLNFRHVPPPHNGSFVGDKLVYFLKDWGIDKKIFSITLDNASYNDGVVDVLKSHMLLKDALICEGKFIHVRCVAHILNLIVQEGLKVAEVVIEKIRNCVKYIKRELKTIAFMELVSQFSLEGGKGAKDKKVRQWNSTFLMLENALEHRRAFLQMTLVDPNFKKICPSDFEWVDAEKIARFLKPFHETTTLFSGCKYPTSNLYFLNMWKIEMVIKNQLKNDDLFLSEMAINMMSKFDKYWCKDNMVLSLAIILDPRYKLKMVDFCYSKLGYERLEVEKLVTNVRDKLYLLFEEYKHASTHSPLCQPMSMCVGQDRDELDDFDSYQNQHYGPNSNKSQLDLYLEEKPLNRKLHADLNILSYWKGNTFKYPELSVMARDILSVPITSVASESMFSIGGHLFGKYWNSLLSSNAEALLCTRDWLNVEKYDSDEEEDEELLVDDFVSTTTSNLC